MNIKVLYVSANGYMGGAERFVCNALIGHKQSKKMNCEVLFFNSGEALNLLEKNLIKTHLLKTKFKVRYIFKLFFALKELRTIIKKIKPDIIHSTMPYPFILIKIATWRLKIKHVLFQHGPVGTTLDKLANLFNVDRILFNSNFLLNEHMTMPLAKRHLEKTTLINLAISDEETTVIRDEFRKNILKNEEKYILVSLGRITSWKGQHLLILGINLLKETHPQIFNQLKVYIIGAPMRVTDESYFEDLKQHVQNYHLTDKIIFTGKQNNTKDWLNASDLLIHTSTIPEPFGLVIGEAMKNNVLCIGSNKGGVTDILIHEKTGFTFNTTASNAASVLSDLIRFSLELPEKEKNYIKTNAKKNIDENYSLESMTRKLENVYLNLVR